MYVYRRIQPAAQPPGLGFWPLVAGAAAGGAAIYYGAQKAAQAVQDSYNSGWINSACRPGEAGRCPRCRSRRCTTSRRPLRRRQDALLDRR